MGHRSFVSMLALAVLVTVPALGQTPKPAPRTAEKKWTPPKSAWGDPDLQGSFTNLSENGTPLERPDQFSGRRLEDIKGEELAAIKQAAQKRTIENFQGPLHALEGWWQPDLNMVKGSQAWLIVDPPDGKIPPLTPEARERAAERAEARRNSGRGLANSWEDRSLYDRCITRGLPGSMMPAKVLHMKYPLSKTGVRVGVMLAIVVGFAAGAQNGQSPEKRITPAEVQWPAASGAGVGTSGVTGI